MADETDQDPEQTAFQTNDVLGGTKLEDGIGLCLSGGGFRAMLFHLGSLIRLNELGLLPKIDRVSSVSGGSLAAGILAAGWADLAFGPDGYTTRFHDAVSEPLLRLARKHVDIRAILLGFVPFVHAANVAAQSYDRSVFNRKTLQDLPDRPRFVFTSTSLQTGVLWRFSREYAADWRVGQWDDPDLRLALAVAASAAFPPMLSPAKIKPPKDSIRPWTDPTTLTAPAFRKKLFLTDGGVYDNLGLEPIWKRYRTLLVSDGGAVTRPNARPFTNWYSQFRRVLDVSLQQGINTRIRVLRGLNGSNARAVAYWGIGTPVDSYGHGNPLGFTSDMTHEASIVPTRLTKFAKKTRLVIVQAGYAHTDAALSAASIPLPRNQPPSFANIPDVG
jgi:NTE family protein